MCWGAKAADLRRGWWRVRGMHNVFTSQSNTSTDNTSTTVTTT